MKLYKLQYALTAAKIGYEPHSTFKKFKLLFPYTK